MFGQIKLTFKSYSVAEVTLPQDSDKPYNWEPCSDMIVIDGDEDKVIFYSANGNTSFSYYDSEQSEDGEFNHFKFYSLNSDGEPLVIGLMLPKDKGREDALYIQTETWMKIWTVEAYGNNSD